MPLKRLVRSCIVVVCCVVARDASAQLLTNTVNSILSPVKTLTCSVSALSSSPKLDAALQSWTRDGAAGSQRVIITARPGLLGAVRTLLTTRIGAALGELTGIGAIIAEVSSADLGLLVCDSSVSSVSLDAVVRPTGEVTADVPYSLRATLGLTEQAPAGNGIGVAVIDSGIASSRDFDNRIVAFYDFTNGARATAPSDGYGHGTHVAGLIAGSGSLETGAPYRGVGAQVRLIGMKVLDRTGAGRTSDVIRAVEYATARRAQLGIRVINLSLGHPVYEPASRDPLVRAVESASKQGIIVVAAAGNRGLNPDSGQTGYGGITSPGNAPSAITVGALTTRNTTTRSDDGVAAYSSRGPSWYDGFAKPDILAPGHALVSTAAVASKLYADNSAARVSTYYLRLSGTSMAAAVATGTVALILEANQAAHPNAPPLTPNAVKAILQYSALPMYDASAVAYDTLTQGAGALNATGAIELARVTDTNLPVGSYWWSAFVDPLTVIAGEAWEWSQHIVWGTNIVWGTCVDTHQQAWSVDITWGGAASWGSHIVWGTDTVWGSDSVAWASNIVWGTGLIGTSVDGDNIVWGTAEEPGTTVWGNLSDASQQYP